MNDIAMLGPADFDRIRRVTEHGIEYWRARDLQETLGYSTWESFENAVSRAREACEQSSVDPSNHFRDTTKKVSLGSGAVREVPDVILSRYGCYLTAMNGDPSKPQIASAQAYFAIQTRRQELAEEQSDEEKRLDLRNKVKDANRNLNAAAQRAGVKRYGTFHDAGYRGMYGGLGKDAIKAKKGIPGDEDLLDCIDRTELAANAFRITQTESKLEREKVVGEERAIRAHGDVGREVRATIERIGGKMPEALPRAESIKKLAAAKRKANRLLPKGRG